MSERKHTPGPWLSKREGFSTVYVEARIGCGMLQEVAACGPTEGGTEQQEANARLIAAAPELLEALEMMVELVEFGGFGGFGRAAAMDTARAAIAKATGESK